MDEKELEDLITPNCDYEDCKNKSTGSYSFRVGKYWAKIESCNEHAFELHFNTESRVLNGGAN